MGPVTYFSLCLLGCLVFSPWLEGTGAASCPPDWLQYRNHCYGFYREKKSWSDAEAQCHYDPHKAHLASILSYAEGAAVAAFTSRLGSKNNVWIGLHDPRQNRRWSWTDGSAHRYSAWKSGEPNNKGGREFCTELFKSKGFKQWNDKRCDTGNAYICKYAL